MLSKITDEVEQELLKTPLVYESVMAHAKENLESPLGHKRIFVGDMSTYIHASDSQKKIMKQLLAKYGSHVLEQVFFELIKRYDQSDWKENWV